MELHQIRYFLALCEELSFTRAAERCEVAQSSLTRAIKALETELGGALFHRERANTHLSTLGEKVKPFLAQAFGQVQGAKRQAQDFMRQQAASLRLGLMRTIAPGRLVALLAAMRARHPDIVLQVTDASAQELQERLLADELDVAIYAHPDLAAADRLSHLPLYRESFVVVVKAAHRLARRGAVRLADLHGEPYLWRAHCEHDAATEAALRQSGFMDPPAFQSDQDAWVLEMAAVGLGYALMPAHSTAHHGDATLVLTEPELAREVALVTARGRPRPAAVGALVDEIMRLRWPGAPLDASAAVRELQLAAQ
jgi:LysR family hydrogen peroxide-inducible transcriptional activator